MYFIYHLKTRSYSQKLRNILHQKPKRQNERHYISPSFLYFRNKANPSFVVFFSSIEHHIINRNWLHPPLKGSWIPQSHRIHINSVILPFTCTFTKKIRLMKIKLSSQICHDSCFIKLEKYSVSNLEVIISFKHAFLLHIILLMSHQIFRTWIKPTITIHLSQPSIPMFQRAAFQYSGAREHCQRETISAFYWDCGPHNERGHNSTSTKAFVPRNKIPFP